jgi:hypothetical protein
MHESSRGSPPPQPSPASGRGSTPSSLLADSQRRRVGKGARRSRLVRVGKIVRAPCPRGNDVRNDFAHPTATEFVIPAEPRQRRGPESITTVREYGFRARAFGASRNDA